MARFRGTSNNDTKRGIPTEENSVADFGAGSDTLSAGLQTHHRYLLPDVHLDSNNCYGGVGRLDNTNPAPALRSHVSCRWVRAVLHNAAYTAAQVHKIEHATGSRH